MMRAPAKRIRRALWTFGQPLTRIPEQPGVPVSDLFVWRNDAEWKTCFELIDIPGLFTPGEATPARHVTFFFFDSAGVPFLEKRVDLVSCQRRTFELSGLIPASQGPCGTFCVFHSTTPDVVANLGSYIAERGYVSYRYKENPLRAYVHGNLDAIAMLPGRALQQLGGNSVIKREFRLQYELRGPARYEVGIVNPTPRSQRVSCRFMSAGAGERLGEQEVQLKPRGCHVFAIDVDRPQQGRVVVVSRLIMGRPLVFRIQGHGMDAFHG